MYPHTTVYYRGTSFGRFSNNGTTTIDPNDDPCAVHGVTWEFGIVLHQMDAIKNLDKHSFNFINHLYK